MQYVVAIGGLLLGISAIAYAATITSFGSGQPISSGAVNTNFTNINSELAALQVTVAANSVPVGTIIDFAGISPPSGYLALPTYPSNISRTTYAALFAAIGVTWGAGNSVNTFGLPWFPVGYTALQSNANVGSFSNGEVISLFILSTLQERDISI